MYRMKASLLVGLLLGILLVSVWKGIECGLQEAGGDFSAGQMARQGQLEKGGPETAEGQIRFADGQQPWYAILNSLLVLTLAVSFGITALLITVMYLRRK